MTRLIQSRLVLEVVCLTLGLSLTQGCAHSEPLHRSDAGSPVSEHKLPFRPDADQASGSEGAHPAVFPDSKVTSVLPFRPGSQPRMLPSGTLLTVQLEDALSAAKVRAGDTFLASVASLAIDGDPLIERGIMATGHVESVRADAGSGYFQLTLTAITVDGRQLALQTSSLFTRGTAQQPDGIRVQKGRRLTFLLTSPVILIEPKSVADRQSLSPTIE